MNPTEQHSRRLLLSGLSPKPQVENTERTVDVYVTIIVMAHQHLAHFHVQMLMRQRVQQSVSSTASRRRCHHHVVNERRACRPSYLHLRQVVVGILFFRFDNIITGVGDELCDMLGGVFSWRGSQGFAEV